MAQAYFEDVAKRVKELQGYIPKVSSSTARLAKKDYAVEFLNTATQGALSEKTQNQKFCWQILGKVIKTQKARIGKSLSFWRSRVDFMPSNKDFRILSHNVPCES